MDYSITPGRSSHRKPPASNLRGVKTATEGHYNMATSVKQYSALARKPGAPFNSGVIPDPSLSLKARRVSRKPSLIPKVSYWSKLHGGDRMKQLKKV